MGYKVFLLVTGPPVSRLAIVAWWPGLAGTTGRALFSILGTMIQSGGWSE